MGVLSILKLIDSVVGCPLCTLISCPGFRKVSEVSKVLIIRPGGIGDAVLLGSTINSLKNSYPGCHITILAERRNAEVFHLINNVDKVLCYDRPHEFIQALRGSYDVVIDTEQWYRLSAVVARLVRAPVKIGFATNERRRMFTHQVNYDLNAPEPDNFLALLKPLEIDCQQNVKSASLSLPVHSVARASQLIQPLCSTPFIVIFPGASIKEKCWGVGRFAQVAKFLSELGLGTVVVGGQDDRLAGDIIAGNSGLNLAGMTTLPETAAIIARSCLMLSGDSGVLHIAAGLEVPTVSLFGPSSEKKWAPHGERHLVLNHHLPCSPCAKYGTLPPCPIDASCMRGITVDEVVNAVTMLLARTGAMPSNCCKRDWIETA